MNAKRAALLWALVGLSLLIPLAACSKSADVGAPQVSKQELAGMPPGEQLKVAAAKGDMALVQQILGSDPSLVNYGDGQGPTPLHMAASGNREDVVKYLLAHGADPLAHDNNDLTPFDVARQQRASTSLQNLLRDAGTKAASAARSGQPQ